MRVPERVHIVPLGYEHDRVVKAADDYKADRVVLLTQTEDSHDAEHVSNVIESLEDLNIDYGIQSCDLFDLYDAIGTIGSIISDHRSDDVYVNISAGSKITAVAGFIASTVTDTTAYYGKAKNYDDMPTGFEDAFQLPHYPINTPDKQQIVVLTVLHEMEEEGNHPTKGELIHIAMQNQLEFTKRNVDEKGLYRLLGSQILDPLHEYGYVESYKDGRKKRVKLTEEGDGAYQAFKALIDTEDIEYGTVGQDEDE